MVLSTLATTIRPDWPSLKPLTIFLAILQFALLVALSGLPSPRQPRQEAAHRLRVLLPFLVAALVPQFVAWSVPHTAVDLLLLAFCGCAIGLCIIGAWLFGMIATAITASNANRPLDGNRA
jgi:hypothetical protein